MTEDTMKVKCIIHEYYDRELDKYIKKGKTLDMEEDRANFLIQKGFVEKIENSEAENTSE
jgi:hypothetical protein